MKILADGQNSRAFSCTSRELIADGSAARGDHFPPPAGIQNAVFFRMWPRMVSPALSSPPARFCYRDELPMYLKPTGVDDRLAVHLGNASIICVVARLARRRHFPFAGFDQVVVHERKISWAESTCCCVDDAKRSASPSVAAPR